MLLVSCFGFFFGCFGWESFLGFIMVAVEGTLMYEKL